MPNIINKDEVEFSTKKNSNPISSIDVIKDNKLCFSDDPVRKLIAKSEKVGYRIAKKVADESDYSAVSSII